MSTARRTAATLSTGLLTLGLLTGCGSTSGGSAGAGSSTSPSAIPSTPAPSGGAASSGSASPAPQTAKIMIMNFAFSGARSVPAGTTITVTNMDKEAHTVTADHGGFDVKVPANSTATFTAPAKPGTYTYHCAYHSDMHGKLTVS